MFKKFDEKENVSGVNNVKSSVQKTIRAKILEQFTFLEGYIEDILPKKEPLRIAKCQDHIEILLSKDGEFLFFRQRDGPFFPTLKLLHKYPFMASPMMVDKGAIKFILGGANIMCPGLTSPGAQMSRTEAGQVVAVMAEGKAHAVAVGLTKLSSDDIQNVNKGIGIETVHYLNDGLWHMKPIK